MLGLAVLLLVNFCFGAPLENEGFVSSAGDNRIVGGHDAVPHAYPWQVSLQYKDWILGAAHHICGATVVDENHILCAAHCVQGRLRRNFQVIAGVHNIHAAAEAGHQTFKVKQMFVNEDYDANTIANDVAVLRLHTNLTFNEYVAPLKLAPAGEDPKEGDNCTSTGWGSTSNTSYPTMPNNLQVVNLPIVGRKTCQDDYADVVAVDEGMVCAGRQSGGISPCVGDSGGPLACPDQSGDMQLAGIVSWGMIPCGQKKRPGVFTNVAHYREWIDETLGNNTMSGSTVATLAVNTVGCYGVGILAGELLYRIALLIEEKQYLYSRYKDRWSRLLSSIFSNEHNQYISFPIALAVCLVCLYHSSMDSQAIILKVTAVALVWLVLRWFEVFDNPVDDIDIINSSNAALGPGLAYNYWNSLLKILLDKIEDTIKEYESKMNERGEIINGRGDRNVAKATSYPRLLILLPIDCDFNGSDDELQDEGVYTHDDFCDLQGHQGHHQVEFEAPPSQRRDPIKMNMKYIKDDTGQKIYVMFDFPQLLKGAMGPKRKCDRVSQKQNLKSFQSTLETLLKYEPYRSHAKNVRFVRYDREKDKPLGKLILKQILDDKDKENQALWSSSSGTEEE